MIISIFNGIQFKYNGLQKQFNDIPLRIFRISFLLLQEVKNIFKLTLDETNNNHLQIM